MSDLLDEIQLYSDNVDAVTSEALNAAADPVLEDARRTTAFHDRTGKLRGALNKSKVKIGRIHRKYILVGVFSPSEDAYYGRMVEFGTSKASAHPFLGPAFEHHKAEITGIIIQKLREALK